MIGYRLVLSGGVKGMRIMAGRDRMLALSSSALCIYTTWYQYSSGSQAVTSSAPDIV